jgi:hypothetical protein
MTMGQWIEQLVKERYKTAKALADAIGISDSGLSKAIKNGTMEVENCLRLAWETGTPAPVIFAMAGKDDVNRLIESLYGSGAAAEVIEGTKTLRLFNSLERPAQLGIANLMQALRTSKAASDRRELTREPTSEPRLGRKGPGTGKHSAR